MTRSPWGSGTTVTIVGPLHWCRCGHGEHEHREWMFECPACECRGYKRDRTRRGRA